MKIFIVSIFLTSLIAVAFISGRIYNNAVVSKQESQEIKDSQTVQQFVDISPTLTPVVFKTTTPTTTPQVVQTVWTPVFLPYNGKTIHCPDNNVSAVNDLAKAIVKAGEDEKTCTDKVFSDYKNCQNMCSSYYPLGQIEQGNECHAHCGEVRDSSLKFCDSNSKVNSYINQIQELCK